MRGDRRVAGDHVGRRLERRRSPVRPLVRPRRAKPARDRHDREARRVGRHDVRRRHRLGEREAVGRIGVERDEVSRRRHGARPVREARHPNHREAGRLLHRRMLPARPAADHLEAVGMRRR